MNIKALKNYIQSGNINFLIGSGLSLPYLSTLGSIENWLTELNQSHYTNEIKIIIQASIYRRYFLSVIWKNHKQEYNQFTDIKLCKTKSNYSNFFTIWHTILTLRNSNILNKQINIFSTNIDMFVEKMCEECQVELNDGFKGRFYPQFDVNNYLQSYTQFSTHFQNATEIPVFNLLKVHGSIDWRSNGDGKRITADNDLTLVESIHEALENINASYFIEIASNSTLENMVKVAECFLAESSFQIELYDDFIQKYNKLAMVNPTKQKFQDTVLDLHFYELLRMYSNALEKENTILFVQGFSFADEHIAKITTRATNANPTLQVIIFSFSDEEETQFKKNLNLDCGNAINRNITILTPSLFKKYNAVVVEEDDIDPYPNFDFERINNVYASILNSISNNIYNE